MTAFITLASFSSPYEYAVLRLLLDQHAIRYFFQNEIAISLLPFHSNYAKGGIFLKVYPDDREQAQHLLAKFLPPS